ncbi:MAG TPA: AgmX/PglI C-terminal domain-containing protein [Kofleriaceae bacterium]
MATSPRSLRVGVLINDQLVEERLFDGATPVTFGQSLRCALSVPVEGVPREHVLFTRGPDGAFALHETSRMQVKRVDKRGRISIGDATILFQEVTTPPRAPRPQLPASIRGTFADRIDRRLAVIIGASLMVHVAIAAWAWTNDIETTTMGLSPVATAYHHDVIDVMVPDDIEPTPIAPTQPGVATPATQKQTPKPIVRPTNIQKPASGDDAQRLASILTGDNDSETGRGGMSGRQPGVDLNKQIDEARNRKITIGDGTQTSRVDDTARMGTRPDSPLVDDQQLTRTDRPNDEQVKGRIKIGPIKEEDPTTLTPQVVLDRINSLYMAGLQRCYRDGLKLDYSLTGKVAIGFTVSDSGRVIDPDASGVSTGVDGCIQRQMGNWRFPIPKDKTGSPTDASFTVSLALQQS